MTVRLALLRVVCGICVAAGALSALAATPANDSAPADAERGSINLDRPAAKAAPAPAPIANPLWAIPLGSLTVTRERPIFTPSRRPPAPTVVAPPPVAAPKAAAAPPPPDRPNLTLIGTVVGTNEGIGVFLDRNTHGLVRLKTGEGHAGWVLRSIKAREATLEKQQRTETLSLPAPHDTHMPAPMPKRPE